nr:MAG TPA: hypothetical protein [Caudoviricetes sp.]DAZ26609.1 MAG TPA: hypothetical protein [Caudoviricetes sp.]
MKVRGLLRLGQIFTDMSFTFTILINLTAHYQPLLKQICWLF